MNTENINYLPNVVNGKILGEKINLAIGTAIAVEKLVDDKDSLSKYDSLYVNIRTVLRNLIGSYEKKPVKIDYGRVLDDFIDELNDLKLLVSNVLPNNWKVVLYYCNYENVFDLFPHAKIKEPNTKIQLEQARLERLAFKRALDEVKDILKFNTKISGSQSKALILTHYPIDLFSHTTFRQLALLESHTGTTKDKTKWITKLTSKDTECNLPFNLLTIQILGDGKTFNSLGSAFNKALLELSNDGNWTTLTTRDRVKFDIDRMKDKYAATIFKEMLTVNLK